MVIYRSSGFSNRCVVRHMGVPQKISQVPWKGREGKGFGKGKKAERFISKKASKVQSKKYFENCVWKLL